MDLTNGAIDKTICDLSQEQIDKSANVLTNILIDFIKSGASIKDITPKNVFGRKYNG